MKEDVKHKTCSDLG